MASRKKAFRVLVATDGSDQARAAITTAMRFPWPAHTQVRVVAARRTRAEQRRSILLAALDRGAAAAAEDARRTLSRRWPEVEAVVLDKTPVDGILTEAERFAADVILLGWRGHGAIRRLLMGSVSRGVVRGARCAVFVVRRAVRVRRIVVGLDGSATAKRALAFVAGLVPPADGRVILLTAVEVMAVPSRGLVPGAVAVAREAKRTNVRRARAAMSELNRAAAQLQRAGWRTRTVLTSGEPLRDLLGTVATVRAQLLVVGATGRSGVRHLLLGSVAGGALNRSPLPILIAR
jgi:nucleotide-binding universal stress UspA family protein